MNAVLHKNFILTKISSLYLSYGLFRGLLILFKLHFELKLSHVGVLFLMSRHERIHKQRFCKIVCPVELFFQ